MMAMQSFWTTKKVERLTSLYTKMQGKTGAFSKIAKQLGTSKKAAYNKLGRLGLLSAPWAQKASKKAKKTTTKK